ncbi:MAG: hypothetical protein IT439_00900 [Phycisphaerales bacterium]|nr:hypothetical protein [Phycisphaerales bacterium]
MRDPRLILAACASLAIHALVVMGAPRPPAPPRAALPESPSPPAEPPVRLGVRESEHVTMTWLGFQRPTPHDARRSITEQPLLALASPAGTLSAAESASAPPAPTPPAPDAAPQPPSPRPSEAISPAAPPPSRWLADAAERLLPILKSLAEAPPAPPAAPPADPPGAPAAPLSSESATSPAEPQPGNSNSESEAAAKTDPISWKPGQTAAAQGLEIETRVPAHLSIPAELLSARIKPVFNLSFGRDGAVRYVEVVRSSGNVNVDEPWVSALYRWRAKGPALDALDPAKPDAVVTIQIQVLPP